MKKVVVIFGLMGTGKTTLARALGEEMGWPVVHSDAVRKTLAGLTPTTPTPTEFGKGIYDEEFSRRTYKEMCSQAGAHLAAGQSVILDGSYKRATERDLVKQLARDHDAAAIFLYCACPLEVVKERLGIRAKDPESISDGREEILEAQAKDFDPVDLKLPDFWGVNTNREMPDILEKVKYLLGRMD
ncbi:MAG: AAA family ATPase [Deltaproteobacteria bacterium]|nr:AAA family ATPase [Deltaproteobacteria bacterium]MBI4794372.1 AAA family ATPase [Deltaproteobacteria bacterium]